MAALIVENSRLVRQELMRSHQQTKNDELVDTVTSRMMAKDLASDKFHEQKLERVAANILRFVISNADRETGTVKRHEARRHVGRDRDHFQDALARLIARRDVIAEGNTLRPKSAGGQVDRWTSFT